MSETEVQIIENATRDDVEEGDYVIWEHVVEQGGVTFRRINEGVAYFRDEQQGAAWLNGRRGDWMTKRGVWITAGEGRGVTITIRRPTTKES